MKRLLLAGLLLGLITVAPAFAGGDAPAGPAGDTGGDSSGVSSQMPSYDRRHDIDPYTRANWTYYWGTQTYQYKNGSFDNSGNQPLFTNPIPGPDAAPEYNMSPAQLRQMQQR